ncbi:MAG: M48 family metalloprotease, partial [Candidatus Acidiferrales bacterium]
EVRCLVFDVFPIDKDVRERFLGRIWVEDQDYTIVRFNGTNAPDNPKGLRPHFDSWRVNAGLGLWVPAYVYSAEAEMSDLLWTRVRFRAQTRLWGYNAKVETEADRTPEESERARSREAEGNAVDRLEASGLLAPSGQLDKILLTVVNNLEVSNNLDIEPEVKCRVLLTSTLESFTIGHTIIVSRGLLDVLPDEASLATVLAHELGHITSGHVMGDQWAFSNWSIFPTDGKFTHFDYPVDPAGEQAANAKAMDILKKSPYKEKLATAGAFLQLIDTESKTLPNLVSPHLESRAVLASQLVAIAPHAASVSAKGPEIVALPIGSRVKMDPWSNQVDMMKTKPVALVEGAEKQPFQISPFMPFLSRVNTAGAKKQVPQQKADEARKQ